MSVCEKLWCYHIQLLLELEKHILECLQNVWVVQNRKDDKEAIEAFLTQPVDTTQLQELKTASKST